MPADCSLLLTGSREGKGRRRAANQEQGVVALTLEASCTLSLPHRGVLTRAGLRGSSSSSTSDSSGQQSPWAAMEYRVAVYRFGLEDGVRVNSVSFNIT